MTYRKKLIEVSLPLELISRQSEKETKIHVGKISNLHAWWSRKPLTSVRAILFASLVDDPSEYLSNNSSIDAIHIERERLFGIIEDLAKWENTNNEEVLDKAKLEIARSVARHLNAEPPVGKEAVREFLATRAPAILDPFAGGGSIPLEAQRLGLRSYASDLNPVAVLINKALIEIPSRLTNMTPVHPPENGSADLENSKKRKKNRLQPSLWTSEWKGSQGLEEDVRYYGKWMRDEAFRRIGNLYPKAKITKALLDRRPELKAQNLHEGNEIDIISWIWARTVECPNPICKFHTPLVNKFWVSTHKNNIAWVNPVAKDGKFEYVVEVNGGEPPAGTVNQRGARCHKCFTSITFDYIREKGRQGEIYFDLMCVVAEGKNKRLYLPADCCALPELHFSQDFIDADLPERALGFRVQNYGITNYKNFFTNRQLKVLSEFSQLIPVVYESILRDANGNREYAIGVITYLAIALNRLAQTNNTMIRWLVRQSGTSKGTPIFDRPIVPMVWEFSEGNVFSSSVGSWESAISNVMSSFSVFPQNSAPSFAKQSDATISTIVSDAVVSTDPPYFDNIGYGHLSDFFYVWLRKNLATYYPELFSTLLAPKQNEIVKNDDADEEQFVQRLTNAFTVIRNNSSSYAPTSIYYAFKQTESITDSEDENEESNLGFVSSGWETMLESLLSSGFTITGTWPIRTESASRLRAVGSNALASSIVLVCRPRPGSATSCSRREFLSALKKELAPALRELQQGSIAPVDLAQAAIGPGMAVFSRYSAVLEADGSTMSVRTALALINQALDEYLAEQEGEYDSDTRWALAWFEQFGHNEAPFGVAETLSKAKNTSVNGLVEAGILEARAGKVRLLKRDELSPSPSGRGARGEGGDVWDPTQDKRPTAWEAVQHLIHALENQGEASAAELLTKLGGIADPARDLAYRLYTVCERKGWAQDALGYNMLVVAWPRLKELAARQAGKQEKLL